MLKRDWVIFAALGFLSLGSLAEAQESQWVCKVRPAIEEGQTYEADCRAYQGSETPSPIVVVETPEQAASSAERARRSDEHEAADLKAQIEAANGAQRAATSAERQEVPTLALAVIGTIIAAIAVALSVWSATASSATARAQLRAYFGVDDITLVMSPDKQKLTAKMSFRNFGVTPAYDFKLGGGWVLEPNDYDGPWDDTEPVASKGAVHPSAKRFITQEASKTGRVVVTDEEISGVLTGTHTFWIHGKATFTDAFRRHQWVKFRLQSFVEDGKLKLRFSDQGNAESH